MPELPEVETIRRDLDAKISGRKISAVYLLSPKTAKHPAAFFKKSLIGAVCGAWQRRGKLLILPLIREGGEGRHYLLIHLKMTGQLIYLAGREKVAGGHSLGSQSFSQAVGGRLPNSQTRAILEFQGGGRLFFNDLRRFGYLKIVSAGELEKILVENYGPEPLTPGFSFASFQAALGKRRLSVKALLLNQKLIAGLGNIYVDESLFAARIDPRRPASTLSLLEARKLWRAIGRIIGRAVAKRGTTFSDYVDSSGRSGNFSRFLRVYGRQGKPCFSCRRPLKKDKVAGRGTHYCPNCQK